LLRDDIKAGESAGIKKLISLLPKMPLIEGVKIRNLNDIRALDKVGFNLVMTFFCEIVRTKKTLPKATLKMH